MQINYSSSQEQVKPQSSQNLQILKKPSIILHDGQQYGMTNLYKSQLNDEVIAVASKGVATSKNYAQYNLQNLAYDIMKEYSHFKADKNSNFMKRMVFDIFKRQTKESRITQLIELNKIKIDENERIQTFNRLIDDANRRIEAQERLDELRVKLNEGHKTLSKKYNQSQWDHVYDFRFKKYIEDKVKYLNQVIEEKLQKEAAEEEKLKATNKPKHASQQVVNASVSRLYAEAERRKLKQNAILNKQIAEKRTKEVKRNNDCLQARDFKLKSKRQPKYNFDTSEEKFNNEKPDTAGRNKSFAAQSQPNIINKSTINSASGSLQNRLEVFKQRPSKSQDKSITLKSKQKPHLSKL